MQEKLYTRSIDELGRVILPLEIRQEMGLEPKSQVNIKYDAQSRTVLMKKSPSLNDEWIDA